MKEGSLCMHAFGGFWVCLFFYYECSTMKNTALFHAKVHSSLTKHHFHANCKDIDTMRKANNI